MITNFIVENFRAARQMALSTIFPTDDYEPDYGQNSVLFTDGTNTYTACNRIPVFGAVASGKTTLINALATLRDLVTATDTTAVPWSQSSSQRHCPSDPPTLFCLDVMVQPSLTWLTYRLAVSPGGHIAAESLHDRTSGATVFTRNITAGEQQMAAHFVDGCHTNVPAMTAISPTKVLLSVVADLDPRSADLRDWFNRIIVVTDSAAERTQHTKDLMLSDPSATSRVAALLASCDLDVAGLKIDPTSGTVAVFSGANGTLQEDLDDASSGVRATFGLAGPISTVISTGGLLIVDDFNRSLHPILAQALVDLFDSDISAQLLFTTNNAGLLDVENLAHNGPCWTVSKDKFGATTILADFPHPRGANELRLANRPRWVQRQLFEGDAGVLDRCPNPMCDGAWHGLARNTRKTSRSCPGSPFYPDEIIGRQDRFLAGSSHFG